MLKWPSVEFVDTSMGSMGTTGAGVWGLLDSASWKDFYFILANALFTFSTDILLQGLEDSTADIQWQGL